MFFIESMSIKGGVYICMFLLNLILLKFIGWKNVSSKYLFLGPSVRENLSVIKNVSSKYLFLGPSVRENLLVIKNVSSKYLFLGPSVREILSVLKNIS